MSNTAVVDMLRSGYADMDWFDKNLSRLKKDFNNSFIAVQNKSILDSDKNLDVLMSKLHSKNVDMSTVFIEFVSNVKSIL